MKWFVTILFSACLFPVPLEAQENDRAKKTEQAIAYLKKIASGELDITKHTALSPNCSIARRKIIRDSLKMVQSGYLRKSDSLTVEAIKQEGQFCAVLVRAENPSTPLASRVLAVALLQKKDEWKPAPLPGSFTNTGYGYDDEVEKTVQTLENWMATEKIKRETAYRNKAAKEFQTALIEIEKELKLQKLNARNAVSNFIELCRGKNLLHILTAMGAASDALADPLEDTIDLVSRGLEADDPESDWHVVTSRSSVFEILNVDDKRSEVAVGFYNPMLRRQSKVLYFPVEKKEDKTFVRLSPILTIALLPQNERWQERWRHRRDDERELILKIPATILKKTEPNSAESPEKLLETFLATIKSNRFRSAIELLPRKGHHFEKEQDQAVLLANLATLWKGLDKVKSSPLPKISIIKEESLALAPLQYSLPNNPGKFQTWNLWMIKSANGWQLVPENSIKIIKDEKIRMSMKTLEKRLTSMTQVQRKELSQKLLSQVLKIDPSKLKDPVTDRQASDLFKRYRSLLRTDDNEAALGCCAVLKGTDDTRTLKNFNYALRGIDDHIKDDKTLDITTIGKWNGISVRTQSKLAGTHDYPLYLCLNSDKGAKILLDIDLRHASNKGRELINKSNWNKLKKALPAAAFKDLEAVFAKHEKLVNLDMEAEKKLHE